MRKTAEFLREEGMEVKMVMEREYPNAPLDYRGRVDGVPWAFELTRLREDSNEDLERLAIVQQGHGSDQESTATPRRVVYH